jgi:ribosome-binding factor A
MPYLLLLRHFFPRHFFLQHFGTSYLGTYIHILFNTFAIIKDKKKMDSTRQSRIGKQIQKDLSEIIREHTSNVAPGKMLTVTKVNVTSDLGLANVNISVFPSDKADDAIKNLNVQKSTIRFELGNKLRHQLRKIPELKFHLDDSLDYIDNIEHLLND